MAPYSSLTAAFGAATQAQKGTPKTTGFIWSRTGESSVIPAQELIDTGPEHYRGALDRATELKNEGMVIGMAGMFSGRMWMYPDTIGTLLRLAGFGVTTAGTTEKTHTFTIADRDDAAWGTVIHQIGEGASVVTNALSDARVTSLAVASGRAGVGVQFQGVGISPFKGTDSETGTDETNEIMIPSKGSITFTLDSTVLSGEVLGTALQIANPVSLGETRLFTIVRSDLPQTGMSIGGRIVGYPVDEALLDLMTYNVAGAVGRHIVTGSLVYKHESVDVISGSALPYSFEVTVPVVRAQMAPFGASGRSLIRTSIDWVMVDASASAPVTIKVVNSQAAPL